MFPKTLPSWGENENKSGSRWPDAYYHWRNCFFYAQQELGHVSVTYRKLLSCMYARVLFLWDAGHTIKLSILLLIMSLFLFLSQWWLAGTEDTIERIWVTDQSGITGQSTREKRNCLLKLLEGCRCHLFSLSPPNSSWSNHWSHKLSSINHRSHTQSLALPLAFPQCTPLSWHHWVVYGTIYNYLQFSSFADILK